MAPPTTHENPIKAIGNMLAPARGLFLWAYARDTLLQLRTRGIPYPPPRGEALLGGVGNNPIQPGGCLRGVWGTAFST